MRLVSETRHVTAARRRKRAALRGRRRRHRPAERDRRRAFREASSREPRRLAALAGQPARPLARPRVHLRRTSTATGAVRETGCGDPRRRANGVVIQTADGIEALRCTGLDETPLFASSCRPACPRKPTLSVRVRAARRRRRDRHPDLSQHRLRLAGQLCRDLARPGSACRLFAWLTLANGDETGFVNADTHGGRRPAQPRGRRARSNLRRGQSISPAGRRSAPTKSPRKFHRPWWCRPPPPPPAPMAERDSLQLISVTGSRIMAQARGPRRPQALSHSHSSHGRGSGRKSRWRFSNSRPRALPPSIGGRPISPRTRPSPLPSRACSRWKIARRMGWGCHCRRAASPFTRSATAGRSFFGEGSMSRSGRRRKRRGQTWTGLRA